MALCPLSTISSRTWWDRREGSVHARWGFHVSLSVDSCNKRGQASKIFAALTLRGTLTHEAILKGNQSSSRCGSEETVGEGKLVGLSECEVFSSSVKLRSLERIRAAGFIACLRAPSKDLAIEAARAALDGGVTVLEVTMTTPSASQVIETLVSEYPSALIGAGTVLSMQDADLAKIAGASFLMTPFTVQEMVNAHRDGPVLLIPGAMTPTEVVGAYNLGAQAVKLFPVTLVGGAKFIQALSGPLGHVPLIASHGITLDTAESYIEAGAAAVVLSDAIFNRVAMKSRDYGKINILARAAALKMLSRGF